MFKVVNCVDSYKMSEGAKGVKVHALPWQTNDTESRFESAYSKNGNGLLQAIWNTFHRHLLHIRG